MAALSMLAGDMCLVSLFIALYAPRADATVQVEPLGMLIIMRQDLIMRA